MPCNCKNNKRLRLLLLETEKEYLDALEFKDKFERSRKLQKIYHIEYVWENINTAEKKMFEIIDQLEHCC